MGDGLVVVLWHWDGGAKAWGRYTCDHVNRAASMVRDNLDLEHEIVVVTDNPGADYNSDLRIVPLWPDLKERGRCWCRIKVFEPGIETILGHRIAWLDLDMVITDKLDPLFDRDEDLVLWRSQTTRCPYNGSILLMTAGARPQVWTEYHPNRVFEPRYPGSDQAWIAHVLGPSEATWNENDGVLSYNRFGRNTRAPRDFCRVMFFPGSIKSNSDIVRGSSPWVQDILDHYGEVPEETYRWKARKKRGLSPHEKRVRQKEARRRGIKIRHP